MASRRRWRQLHRLRWRTLSLHNRSHASLAVKLHESARLGVHLVADSACTNAATYTVRDETMTAARASELINCRRPRATGCDRASLRAPAV